MKTARIQILAATLVLASATPFTPKSDSTVVEKLPRSLARVKVSRVASAAKSDKLDRAVAIPLARQHLQMAQRTSDPSSIKYAEEILNPFFASAELDNELLYLRAVLRQHQHAFDEALRDLDRILMKCPEHPAALLTKASLLTVQGRYIEARQIFQKHLSLTGTLEGMSLFCWLTSLNGSLESSYQLLSRHLAGSQPTRSEECFIQATLGEMSLRRGDNKSAEGHLRRALALEPENSYVLACLGDLYLAGGRAAEVTGLINANTRSEALLLRKAIAGKRLNYPTTKHETTAIAGMFRQSGHFRELAAFQLHVLRQPEEALKTALCNWETQKEPIDAGIVLEAAKAAGRWDNAAPVLDWVREYRVEDVRLRVFQSTPLSMSANDW